MKVYEVGKRATLAVTLTNAAGTPVNPTTTTLTVEPLSGTQQTPSLTNVGVGMFTSDVDLDEEGTWRYTWEGTGALVVTVAGEFYVRRRMVE